MKTAIVGCGNIAKVHVPYILETEAVQLAAVCDQNEVRARELTRQHNVPCYTDLTRMLAETRPDAVHILTPPQTHTALAIQVLEAGCHVLVEKPLCLTSEEADSIYAAAQSASRLVSVGHTHLWSPLVQRARQVVTSGRLGNVLHIQYVIGDDFLEVVKGGYARWALELRGGIFCDLIPHPLYLIRAFLLNAQVVSARACGTGIHDLRELWVDFGADGAGASLWMSLNQRPLEHNLRLFCERGTVYIDFRNFCLAVMPERGLPGPIARIVNTLSESWQRVMDMTGNAFGMLLRRFDPKAGTAGAIHAFYQAIAKGEPSPVSPEEARAVVELSTAIWDILQRKHGAISPSLDNNGRVIVHKTPADFAKSDETELPKVLVTGGTGFIGRHLVRRLVAEGQRVRVLCREWSSLESLPNDGVEIAFGDVTDLDSVHKAMQGIEVLYHLAATMNGDWGAHYQGTVIGTQNVLQAAVQAGVKKVVYVSSLGVLHASCFPNDKMVDESFPLEERPKIRGNYSRAKLEAEQAAREFAKDGKLSICIIRPGLVYGPGKEEFLSDAGFRVGNGLVLVVGMGRRRLGLTYVENLVDALLLAEQSEHSAGRLYHIVDPDQPTVWQYILAYRQITGRRLMAIYLPTFLWTVGFGLLDRLVWLVQGTSPNLTYRLRSIASGPRYDTRAAQKELGWEARVSFTEGMKRSLGQ